MIHLEKIQASPMINNPSPEQLAASLNKQAVLHGSVHRIRKMSGFSFLILRTADSLIQCILEPEKCRIEGLLKEEACIRAEATVTEEPRSRTGWELHLTEIKVLSSQEAEIPVVIHGK